MTHDVFISYAHEDVSRARRLAQAFVAARGWSIWWDTSLKTGEQYPRRIQESVAASRSVVVLWSRYSVTSDWVIAESSEGWNRKILVPVQLDDSEPPLPFRQTQSRNLSHWRGGHRDAAVLALIEDIQRVHAQGPEVSAAELAAREQRRRDYERRQWLRRTAYAAVVLLAVSGGWFGWRTYQSHARLSAAAEQLAREADVIRGEVLKLTPDEEKRIWWTQLHENSQRLSQLELSVLLGVEAVQHLRTEHTEHSLRDSLALLPWSDQQLIIDRDDLPIALDFSGDGRLLAAGGGMHGVLVWDLDLDKVVARIEHGGTGGLDRWEDKRGTFLNSRGSRAVIDFDPVRDQLATAGPDATARVWDARSGKELLRLTHDELVTAVAFDSHGRWLATSDESGAVCLWDAGSGQQLHCMKQGAPVYWIGFSPSSAWLTSVSRDAVINLWRPESGELQQRIAADTGVRSVRFDRTETMLATFGAGVATRLWNLVTGAELWELPIDADGDAGVVFDAGGKTMIVGQADGELSWWDLNARRLQFTHSMGAVYILAMAAAPGSDDFVTISADQEARAWELQSGRLLKRMPYSGDLMGLAVSADGERFATMGDDGDDRVIEITSIWPADPVAAACAKLTRNLTRNEWRQYLQSEPYRLTCPSIRAEHQ